jgi:hypothetical protein
MKLRLAPKFITAMCDVRKHLLRKEPIREHLIPLCTFVSSVV